MKTTMTTRGPLSALKWLAILGAVLTTGAGAAAESKITKNAFVFNGGRYFRGQAENVHLCSYGEKKTPIGRPNYLALFDTCKPEDLAKVQVEVQGPFAIDWSKESAQELSVGASFLGAGGKVEGMTASTKTANLRLVKLILSEKQLLTLVNKHAPAIRNRMDQEGNDARIVSEVWVVMEATLASEVQKGVKVSAKAPVGASGVTVEVGAGTESKETSTVSIPRNAIFAYKMHKVKKWGPKKDSVESMEDDAPGLN